MRLEISEEFFREETRCNFVVSEDMKRCWAASMKVLSVIDDVCRQNDIRYCAMFGTLLGAVRHKGFIPWDDDIDIAMLRPDYDKFFRIAQKALPEGYEVISFQTLQNYSNMINRVTNRVQLDQQTVNWRKKNFYGFPFIAGIDIFPLDYIPEDSSERDMFYNIINILRIANEFCKEENHIGLDKREYILSQVESLLNVRIERNDLILTQLAYLTNSVCSMYGPNDSKTVSVACDRLGAAIEKKYLMPVSLYQDLIDMDFEMIKIPVPRDYDMLLRGMFGKDYMKPVRYSIHGYPYYRNDQKMFKEKGLI